MRKQKDRINNKKDHDLQCSIASDKLEMDAKYSKAAKIAFAQKCLLFSKILFFINVLD